MNLQEAEEMVTESKRHLSRELVETSDPVSMRQIKAYIAAVDDWDPLYFDEDAARKGPIGKITAPAMFYSAPLRPIVSESDLMEDGQHKTIASPGINGRSIAAGNEVEFYKPLHIGDIVTGKTHITDVYAKQGRSGAMVFQVRKTTYANQNGDVLAIERTTLIFR